MTEKPAEEPQGMRDQLREEAATWFARMRGEDADRHRAAFERWLARGAVHRAAYNRIGEVFAAGKSLKPQTEDAGVTAGGWRGSRVAAAALGAGALAAIAVPLIIRGGTQRQESQEARGSGPILAGERMTTNRARRFALANGASVVLDTDSLLVGRVGGSASVYRLVRGRGRFEVSKSRGRLQVVLAGPAVVTSDGGTFDLWLRSDGSLDAQAFAGRVGLRQTISTGFSGAATGPGTVLPGRHYRMTSLGHTTILTETLGRDWPRGILEFRGTPLADVVEEANRYGVVRIILGDATLGRVRVSGRFRIDEPERLAERLATVLGLRLDRDTPGTIVLRRERKTGSRP